MLISVYGWREYGTLSIVVTIHILTKPTEHWIETETLVYAFSQIDDLRPVIKTQMEFGATVKVFSAVIRETCAVC